MGSLIGVKVYVAVLNKEGDYIYSDEAFDEQQFDFIKKFVQTNFNYLKKGEHSIPLSSENIIFFKTSNNTMTILYNPKGKIGQLLAFKSMINNYSNSLDSSIITGEVPKIEEIKEVPNLIESAQKAIEAYSISRRKKYYSKIKPILSRELKKKDKFNLTQSIILNKCDGNFSLSNIMEITDLNESEVIENIYNFYTKKVIELKDFELLRIQCPECKKEATLFLPKVILSKSEIGVRIQLFPPECGHTFVAFIDKKLKIKTKPIEKLIDPEDSLDLTNLSIEKLISFFGQDIFFNIFHAIFFRFYTVFIGEEEVIKIITQFLRKIFAQLEYGRHIFSINQAEFEKNTAKYREFLIIDFDSMITIDPYEEKEELFDFEFKLFKKVLKTKGDTPQILETYSEFERLILLTDTVLKELEPIKQISEDDLMKTMDSKYQMTINRYEIPVIKKLSEIYYNTDILKKVTRTVVGQMSNWFEKI